MPGEERNFADLYDESGEIKKETPTPEDAAKMFDAGGNPIAPDNFSAQLESIANVPTPEDPTRLAEAIKGQEEFLRDNTDQLKQNIEALEQSGALTKEEKRNNYREALENIRQKYEKIRDKVNTAGLAISIPTLGAIMYSVYEASEGTEQSLETAREYVAGSTGGMAALVGTVALGYLGAKLWRRRQEDQAFHENLA